MKETLAFFASSASMFLACSLYAGNLVFNGSFELGSDGFGMQRTLRPDTNPKLEFHHPVPDTTAFADGRQSLLIDNSTAEFFQLFSKEFPVEKGKNYTLRVKMKSDVSDYQINVIVYGVKDMASPGGGWFIHSQRFSVGKEWKEYEFSFTPKISYVYVIQIRNAERKNIVPARLWLDQLSVIKDGDVSLSPLQVSLDAKEKLYEKTPGLQCPVSLKVYNPNTVPVAGKITVKGVDEFTGTVRFSREIPVQIPTNSLFTTGFKVPGDRYGSTVLSAESTLSMNVLPGQLTIIGQYESKPLEPDKEFCLGFNGGLNTTISDSPRYNLGYWMCDSPDEMFSLLSRMGCRMLRDHDAGMGLNSWANLEPREGQWDNSWLSRGLALYEKYHLIHYPVIGRGDFGSGNNLPDWVVPRCERVKNTVDKKQEVLLPPLALWRKYVRKYAQEVKGHTRYFEILNEPNLYLAADTYLKYLQAASEEIRSVIPDAQISGFCLTSDFSAETDGFSNECFDKGGLNYVDSVGFHPYSSRELGSLVTADKTIAGLRKKTVDRGAERPLWNSELYYLFDNDFPHGSFFQMNFLPHHLARRFLTDLGENVAQSLCVPLDTVWRKRLCPETESFDCYEYLPGMNYCVANTLARLFERAQPVEKIRLNNGAIVYVYRKEGKLIAAVWNYDETKELSGDFSKFQVLDLFGNLLNGGALPVTHTPYYLQPGKLSDAEFIAALKALPLSLAHPVSVLPLARKVGNQLWVALRNSSEKTQSGTLGVSGNLTALKPIDFKLAPNAEKTFFLPVKAGNPRSQVTNVMFFANERMTVFPVDVRPNKFLKNGEAFTIKSVDGKLSAAGEVKFDAEKITVKMTVKDATPAEAIGEREMWETDCLELFFDLNPEFLPPNHPQAYTQETFRVFIMPHNPAGRQLVFWGKKSGTLSLKKAASGYEALLEIPTATGSWLGFDAKLNDAENSAEKAIRSVSWTSEPEPYKNRCNFGVIEK